MQPAVQPTTRTPGPSTVAPVVNECRKPMSPVASADLTLTSGTSLPRLTLSSYGLFASRAVSPTVRLSDMAGSSMEGPVDDVHLLVARQSDEVHCITGYADRQTRILFRMLHRVDQHFAVQHVDVHVEACAAEECVEHRGEIVDAVLLDAAEPLRDEARGQRDAVSRVAVRNLRDRRGRRVDAVTVAA